MREPKKGDLLRLSTIRARVVIEVLDVDPGPGQWAWRVKGTIVEHAKRPDLVGDTSVWNLSPDVCEQVKR